MVKKVVTYEASDGKSFKTKQGAENHSKRIVAKEVLEKLNMTEAELTQALKEVSPGNMIVRELMRKHENDWKKWPVHLINQIDAKLLKGPQKETVYVKASRSWLGDKEEVVAVEKGEEFTDDNKHNGDKYKVDKVEEVDNYKRKVYLRNRYTEGELAQFKLEKGEDLKEREIRALIGEFPEIYEEEGDEGRWERYMTTVIEIGDKLYAIEWSAGLTEMQEDSFFEQPYEVTVEEKEVTITKTVITAVQK